MNINEEQNPVKLIRTLRAHWELYHSSKLHTLNSINIVLSVSIQRWANHIEREIWLSNNATLSQSELIRIGMFFVSYDKSEHCFCSLRAKKTLAFDCTFQCCSFKKDWLWLINIHDQIGIREKDRIIEVRIIEVRLYNLSNEWSMALRTGKI